MNITYMRPQSCSSRAVTVFVLAAFILSSVCPLSYAQTLIPAAPSVTTVNLSPAFSPAVIKGLKVFADNPLKFDFIVDKADTKFDEKALKEESTKLI